MLHKVQNHAPSLMLVGQLFLLNLVLIILGCGEGAQTTSKPSIATVIGVSMRASAMQSGKGVVQITNLSAEEIDGLELNFFNTPEGQQMSFTLNLKPSETREFGWVEGWSFEPGEIVLLKHQDYAPEPFEVYALSNGAPSIRHSDTLAKYQALTRQAESDRIVRCIGIGGMILIGLFIVTSIAKGLRRPKKRLLAINPFLGIQNAKAQAYATRCDLDHGNENLGARRGLCAHSEQKT